MKRREFLTRTMLLGVAGLGLRVPRLYGAPLSPYSGRLLVTLQAEGGWDVTSFCDPKVNQPGEPEITNWSKSKEIRTAGNLKYAPFAKNTELFEKYHRYMLVINGIDAQTNSHTTGVLHNWSGRNAEGFPSLTALFAAHNAPKQPLSYINFGGFGQTGGVIRFSRLDDVNTLRGLLEPAYSHFDTWGNQDVYHRRLSDMERIRKYRQERFARMLEDPRLLARQQANLEAYADALESKSALVHFSDYIPAESDVLEDVQVHERHRSNLPRQIQMTIAAFRSGLASAADLYTGGYDTHTDHDNQHQALFSHLADMIDLFWTHAEEAGVADRITLVIGSDFGRTPQYNADDGKDHWPIGSVIVMERNAAWGNRVAGLTDEGHNALKVQPTTLKQDRNGTLIYPKHVHKALRRHLGLGSTTIASGFPFNNTEDFAFFG
ncbi:MAG: DUF1501 domain-containing protein [bacterium]